RSSIESFAIIAPLVRVKITGIKLAFLPKKRNTTIYNRRKTRCDTKSGAKKGSKTLFFLSFTFFFIYFLKN
ncbi:MAG: hypothetical protein MJY99_12155, partial [Fibrobacter sp.]|nr:hypothetical protein [Fibrobacter sp.]